MVLKVIVESRFSSECNGQPSECYKQGNNTCFVKKTVCCVEHELQVAKWGQRGKLGGCYSSSPGE